LDDSHFAPTFIASDIEEIRNNPDARKILRQFQIFSGQNQKINNNDKTN